MPTLDFTRNPDLGDSIITKDFTVVRRNINNKVSTVRSPKWPVVSTFRFTISGLDYDKKEEVMLFLRTYAGQEITLIDYNGVPWIGVVVEDPVAQQTGPDHFEGNIRKHGVFTVTLSLEGNFDISPISS